ncbi:hypothetical protein P153DRAFT_33782 [Dothidotthia symphoricarpi CBS 119687]|uniref:Uncharacterized protein n=1 Tax=Dothidotthia symphoricarpi CBS 119687 TaxID=1392245 RepID=A0A6A6ABI6_9PLEO|nr:uncharacterized protein P153DRAFT_33782 [Dothidotthia symphoricarpi CBS 119687]KAF2129180.1 hypothetical protein P153DRAFT_33782 [Dothidotthia symphoricarpi CBS 119687]
MPISRWPALSQARVGVPCPHWSAQRGWPLQVWDVTWSNLLACSLSEIVITEPWPVFVYSIAYSHCSMPLDGR